MARFEYSIEVSVPVSTAYNQWTQFEEFPLFMEGVKSVEQRTDTMLHWVAEIAGRTEQWDAEITDQRPDNRIAWQSTSGAKHSGLVTFHFLAPERTLIMLVIDYDPSGFIENVGAALGVVERRMAGDLKRFKEYIEGRGYETGAWRGEVDPYEDVKPFGSRYTGSEKSAGTVSAAAASGTPLSGEASFNGSATPQEGRTTSTGYVGAPSFTSGESEPTRAEERGSRNELGDNSFTSGENAPDAATSPAGENWSTSRTPSAASSAPLNDLGNSDAVPGDDPAHSFGAVEDEPQDEDWNEEYVRPNKSPINP